MSTRIGDCMSRVCVYLDLVKALVDDFPNMDKDKILQNMHKMKLGNSDTMESDVLPLRRDQC